ncbi:MAG: PKD domain-containing protein, partial [bacterium]
MSGTDGTCSFEKPGDPDWLFERFTYAMGYAECAGSIAEWRAKSPECRLVLYVSGTDLPPYKSQTSNMYNGGKKSTWIRNRLVELGEVEETAYLHFYDDTYLRHWNGSSYDTLRIPGTYSFAITAADSASRVPNSYVNALFVSGNTYEYPTRLSPNFASPQLRLAYKEYLTQIFNEQAAQHWPEATGTWDGIHFDNYSPYGMVGSALCGGGHVVESADASGSMQVFSTDGYLDWTWELMKTFGREVRDTLQVADHWSTDGNKKILAYNVGISHRDDYLDPEISGADALNIEYGFEPVYSNNSSYYRLENLYSRDSLAAANGVTYFWTSIPRTTYGNGHTTRREALYNNLCFYYVARSDSTWIYMRPDPGYAYAAFLNPGFDTLAWVPAMEQDLGNPLGHYELLATGSSPDQSGAAYKIWSRQYERGLVLIRPRDGFDAAWGATSQAIEVDLGGSFRQLNPDGSLGDEITTIALRGAAGAILLPTSGEEGYLDFSGSPASGCAPLAVDFSAETSYEVGTYSWSFGDGQVSSAAAPSHTYTNAGQYSVSLVITTADGQHSVTHNNLVSVCEPPVASFSASVMSGTAPLLVSFTDLSSGAPTSWSWDFGDGGASNVQNPSHSFVNPGDYVVTMTVAADCCEDPATTQLPIRVDPVDDSEIHAVADTLFFGEEYGELECGYRSDDINQVVIESTTNGHPRRRTSRAEYRWHFWKPAGEATISVEARRSPNADGDDFVIEYSLDDQIFQPLLTVTSAGEEIATAALPATTGDTVYIRAVDTDATYGHLSRDTLYVDHLYLEMVGT